MELQPFRNQYIISNSDNSHIQDVYDFEKRNLLGLNIYSRPPLDINYSEINDIKTILIGYALDPLCPELDNQEIVDNIAKNCKNIFHFFRSIQKFSGRFVFIFQDTKNKVVAGDAAHFRQIYYSFDNGNLTLTSSPKLFLDFYNYELKMNSLKKEFTESEIFKSVKYEHAWFGSQSPDDRLNKLLPNHYVDLQKRTVSRIYPFDKEKMDYATAIVHGSKILEGTYEALLNRNYKIVQAITAGWDSRVLLSSSKKHKQFISYYVFDRGVESDNQDIRIPNRLANQLDIDFRVIKTPELSDNIINILKQNYIFPRIIPITRNIQAHLKNHNSEISNQNFININGNIAELLRSTYGNNRGRSSVKMMQMFTRYYDNDFIRQEIEKWKQEASNFAESIGFSELDLFYWEQFMGNKGALVRNELDIAIEEIAPFNNKDLLFTLYHTGEKYRKKPRYQLFRDLIEYMWPEVLKESINPDDSRIKSLLKRNAKIRYYVQNLYLKLSSR